MKKKVIIFAFLKLLQQVLLVSNDVGSFGALVHGYFIHVRSKLLSILTFFRIKGAKQYTL